MTDSAHGRARIVLATLFATLVLLSSQALAQGVYNDTLYRNWTPEHLTALAEISLNPTANGDWADFEAVIATGPLAGVPVWGRIVDDAAPIGGGTPLFGTVDIVYSSDECNLEMFIEVTFVDGPLAGSEAWSERSADTGYC